MKVKNKQLHFFLPTNTATMKMQEEYSHSNHKLATGVILCIYLHWFAVWCPVFCNQWLYFARISTMKKDEKEVMNKRQIKESVMQDTSHVILP